MGVGWPKVEELWHAAILIVIVVVVIVSTAQRPARLLVRGQPSRFSSAEPVEPVESPL